MPRPWRLLHWRRAVPLLVMGGLLAATGVIAWRSVTPQRSGSGSFVPQMTDPPITIAELETADGAETLFAAVEQAMGRLRSGSASLGADLVVNARQVETTNRSTSRATGWPIPWSSYSERVRLDAQGNLISLTTDPDARSELGFGLRVLPDGQVPPRPRRQWQGSILHLNVPPEEAGGAHVQHSLRLAALALPVAVAWTAGLLGLGGLAVVERIRRRPVARRRRRWLVGIGAVVLVAVAGVAVTRSSEGTSIGTDTWNDRVGGSRFRFPRSEIKVDGVDIATLASAIEADRDATREMVRDEVVDALASRAPGPPGPDATLLVTVQSRARVMSNLQRIERPIVMGAYGSSTWRLGDPSVQRPNDPVVALPAGTNWELTRGFLIYERSDGDPTTPSMYGYILLVETSLVLLVILGAGGTASLVCGLIARWQARRRRAADRCPACNHAFPPVVPDAGA